MNHIIIIICMHFFSSVQVFIKYLFQWEKECKFFGYNFITDNTCLGLKVTLKAT